jgi:hypothetical protein
MARPCVRKKRGGSSLASILEGKKWRREGEGWMVSMVVSTTMHRQCLHHYARFEKKPRVEREGSGGGDGDQLDI